MPLYQDGDGGLYWHDRIAPVLEPTPPSARRAAHGLWPTIAQVRPERAAWLGRGSLLVAGVGLLLTALSLPLTHWHWPAGSILSAAAFLWAGWARAFFVEGLCSRRVRFDRPLRLAGRQPWQPDLLPLVAVLSLGAPVYALTWAPGLDAAGDGGRSVLPLLILLYLLYRAVRRWLAARKAIRHPGNR